MQIRSAAMSYKTILTVTGPGFGDGDLKLTAGLCEQVGAHLSVLVVALAAPPPIGSAAEVSMVWLDEREEEMKRLDARTAAVSGVLAGHALSADVSSEYTESGRGDEAIGRRARYADLTVIGPDVLASEILGEKATEGVLFSSGKPLLLVPEGASPTLRPKRVLVAWDTRIEASRAVRESLDMLKAADDVRLVLVDPVQGEDHHGEEPGADVAAYLSRQGVKVTIDRLPRINRSTADVLRRHALDMSAELMVMGAYGHSRLRERLFGGVTKSMLAQPSLPILMAR
jgi:nucleotide-binding universal stress UspA family protein